MRRPFHRNGDVIEVSLSRRERSVLSALPATLASLRPDEPAAERLDPPAYPEDGEASEGFRDLVADDLRNARHEDRAGFARSVRAGSLTDEEAEMWIRVIGDTRILIGARLGIEDDGWEGDRSMAESPEAALLHYLGYLQDSLAHALGEGLDPPV